MQDLSVIAPVLRKGLLPRKARAGKEDRVHRHSWTPRPLLIVAAGLVKGVREVHAVAAAAAWSSSECEAFAMPHPATYHSSIHGRGNVTDMFWEACLSLQQEEPKVNVSFTRHAEPVPFRAERAWHASPAPSLRDAAETMTAALGSAAMGAAALQLGGGSLFFRITGEFRAKHSMLPGLANLTGALCGGELAAERAVGPAEVPAQQVGHEAYAAQSWWSWCLRPTTILVASCFLLAGTATCLVIAERRRVLKSLGNGIFTGRTSSAWIWTSLGKIYALPKGLALA